MTSSTKNKITLIAGLELTIESRPLGQLQFGSENPGTICMECNGKAWNMALDLVRDGFQVDFVGVAGNDFAGMALKARLETLGVGVEHFHLIDGKDTSAKLDILNLLDHPEMTFQNGEVFLSLTKDMIDAAGESISKSDCILLETRFSEDVLAHVVETFSKVPVLLMPDSEESAAKAKAVLPGLGGILTGRRAAEVLSGLSILSEEEMKTAGEWFYDKGIPRVYFDLGFGGLYYKDKDESGVERPGPVRLATVVGGFVENRPVRQTASEAVPRV